jgi:pyrroline-5-carboxylate reductase
MARIGKTGFVGVGKMGGALLDGALKAGLLVPSEVLISEPDRERSQSVCNRYGVRAADTAALAAESRVILLCVKPQIAAQVLEDMRQSMSPDKLVLSIAAGVTTGQIEAVLGGTVPVVRAMPNIAATVGESATALTPGVAARSAHLELARTIFGAVGAVVELPERMLDAVTGLSGSGPAYVFLFAEALISGALKAGLPQKEARRLAVQTLKGAAAMLEAEPETHPAVLRDAVTTPGGTTIAGLHELEKRGFRDAVISAVEAASRRSAELGGAVKK